MQYLSSTNGIQQRIFQARLRQLLRLLVDLEGGVVRITAKSDENRSDQTAANPAMWHKKIQGKGTGRQRSGASGESKSRTTPDSLLSAATSKGKDNLDAASKSTDGFGVYTSKMPEVAKCWSAVVKCKFAVFVERELGGVELCDITRLSGRNAIIRILDYLDLLRQAGIDLLGNRCLFIAALHQAVWNIMSCLSLQQATSLSYICNLLIDDYVFNPSDNALQALFTRLQPFLMIAGRGNFLLLFEHFYCSMLAERLLRHSTSYSVEHDICSSLHSCFLTTKPKAMLIDFENSDKIWKSFITFQQAAIDAIVAQHVQEINLSGDDDCGTSGDKMEDLQHLWTRQDEMSNTLSVTTLCSFTWSGIPLMMELPPSLSSYLRDYETYFALRQAEAHVMRNGCLKWTLGGTAVVRDNVRGSDITVTTVQMMLLLEMNNKEQVTKEKNNSDYDALVDNGVIQRVTTSVFSPSDKQLPSAVSCITQQDNHHKSSMLFDVEHRNSVLDSCIMRILKQEQSPLLGDVLIARVIQQEQIKMLNVQALDVRYRCQHLIRLGYVTHDDVTPHMLQYAPDNSKQKSNLSIIDDATSPVENAVIPTQFCVIEVNTQKYDVTPTTSQCRYDNSPVRMSSFRRHTSLPAITSTPSVNVKLTTLTVDQLLIEIRKMIARYAEILSLDVGVIETKLLDCEWNTDRMVEENFDTPETPPTSGESPSVCPVCCDPLPTTTTAALSCGHVVCLDCWRSYLTLQLTEDRAINTSCPLGECRARPYAAFYHRMFADSEPALYQRYEQALVRSYVESDRSLSWCHNPRGCPHVVRIDQSGGSNSGTCGVCAWQTCFACTYVEWHAPATCSHISQWIDDGGYHVGMNEDAQSKHLARMIAKRCPNCQAHIEKNDGCLHMKCSKCSHDFCWRCLQPWRPTHRDYYKCSSKMSRLAHTGLKFVEFNRKCQFHHEAVQFTSTLAARLAAIER